MSTQNSGISGIYYTKSNGVHILTLSLRDNHLEGKCSPIVRFPTFPYSRESSHSFVVKQKNIRINGRIISNLKFSEKTFLSIISTAEIAFTCLETPTPSIHLTVSER